MLLILLLLLLLLHHPLLLLLLLSPLPLLLMRGEGVDSRQPSPLDPPRQLHLPQMHLLPCSTGGQDWPMTWRWMEEEVRDGW